MRCWVFDWPGLPFPEIVPGMRPPPLPDPEVLHPSRKWVYDGPSGMVWVFHDTPFVDDGPKLLMSASGLPAVQETDVLAAIQEKWKGANVVHPERPPGERYHRIWRGQYWRPTAEETHAFVGAVTSANLLRERFRRVLMTLEPDPENRKAYGHELRQLLILASTEVESAWRSILLANGYPDLNRGRFNTTDYCKLRDPLRLTEWELALVVSGRYGPIAPFRGWDLSRPTDSLPWYDDHHAAKHDREMNLAKASLENVIDAMAALEIMLAAQTGPPADRSESGSGMSDFRVTQRPIWQVEEEYVPPLTSGEAHLVNYPFPTKK
jgi:hypothetical protein